MISETVEVLLVGGERVSVGIDCVVGPYAIHKRVRHDRGWTVTHKATGYSIWSVEKYTSALMVARWLDENKKIPEGAAEMLAWKDKMTTTEGEQLRDELARLAPRLT